MGGNGGNVALVGATLACGAMIQLPGMARIWQALPEARMVGGAVRDMLAGRAVADVDFAVPLSPEAVMARAQAAGLKYVPTGLAHGTITIIAAGQGFEVTSLRRDERTDGRHAQVRFIDDWQEDAARRDFTINAMSCTQDQQIFDYFGGREDLQAGIIRFVGAAPQRILEDYLRILRFFRFFARYAKGPPDAAALAAIKAGRAGLSQLSVERIWSELKQILKTPAPLPAVKLMQTTGVLEIILPGAKPDRFAALLARGAPPVSLLRLAALTDENLAERLRLSGAEADLLAAWRGSFSLTPASDDNHLRQALANTEHEILIGQSWLYGDESPGWAHLRARLAAFNAPVFPLLGRDLRSLGVEAGPKLGEILQAVRQWWWENGCMADQTACLAQAEKIIAKTKQNSR